MADENYKVATGDLYRSVPDDTFDFETTETVQPLEGLIGQDRAVKSIDFGLQIRNSGYNIYMAGQPGTGKTTYIQSRLVERASNEPVPDDWVYVYNFEEEDIPLAIRLPAGWGRRLEADMNELVNDLQEEIPQALDQEDFENQRNEIVSEIQDEVSRRMSELERRSRQARFALKRTPAGFMTIPLDSDGEPISQEAYQALPDDVREEFEAKQREVQADVAEVMREVKNLQKKAKTQLEELEQNVVLFAVRPLFEQLIQDYEDHARIVRYLKQVQEDVLNHIDDFKDDSEQQSLPLPFARGAGDSDFTRYEVNLLVDHTDSEGAPVVFETNPTYFNVFGKTEYEGRFGNLVTDFTHIKAGALHQANGGYLIMQARDALTQPLVWEALKRAIRDHEIRIENLSEQARLIATAGLKPEPLPLDVKIILIGNPYIHALLHAYDEDYKKYFKIKADFDTEMPRSVDNAKGYAAFISSFCRNEDLKHFHRSAVARVIEYSSRLASDQQKLSTRFNRVTEILYEASTWAEIDGAPDVRTKHVDQAIEEKIYRSNQVEEKILEMIEREHLLIQTEGQAIGQVNGLAVLQLGDYRFGKPSRITAETYMGKSGVTNIEREADLSGNIHDKGVLILQGYLGRTYAQEAQLNLSASLTFEQNYEGVDGDSASSTELYALISSLSKQPLRQDIAVTGSVNQKGDIQPIGGVNEKIEGFFHTCQAKGLTGTQGVMIPHQNVENLMLKQEVIDAIKDGMFHIYAVKTINEGLEVLSGQPAETVHAQTKRQLEEWNERLKSGSDEDSGE